jgi:predicted enzyme related to lactoylglutathione lyase
LRLKETFVSYLHGKFVWFEHVSNDVPKARKFYEALFGWNTEAMPVGDQRYFMIHNGEDGIGGYCVADPDEPNHWVGYMSVDDVDAAYARALAAGAKSLMEPSAFGSVGRGAALTDPTGAAFSLWKGSQGDRPDVPKLPSGEWGWNELWTTDLQKALSFYENVFGYTADRMDTGGNGTYYALKKDGIPRAGLSQSVDPKAKSMWLPYVVVADADACAAKAVKLGGQVVHGPADIPGIGRFAVMIDPQNAPVAVIKPLADNNM